MADEAHTGAMIALVPTDADAERLAVPGGEPIDELHVTLRYLGDAVDFNPQQQASLIESVRHYVDGMPSVEGNLSGLAMFNPDGDEPCVVGLVGGDDVWQAYNVCADALDDTDLGLPDPLMPWCSHLTLEYTDDASRVADLVDRAGPVTFDRVRVAFGGEVTDILLAGPADDGGQADEPAYEAMSALDLWAAADEAREALGHDTHPGGERLRRYWTEGPGLARWDESPEAFTTLRDLLVEKAQVPAEVADRWAAAWFKQVKGYWPGSHLNKAAHDLSPAGEQPEVPGRQVARAVRAAAEKPDRSGVGRVLIPAATGAAALAVAAAGATSAAGAAGAETEEKRKRDGRAAAR